jgi:hypothetical protein
VPEKPGKEKPDPSLSIWTGLKNGKEVWKGEKGVPGKPGRWNSDLKCCICTGLGEERGIGGGENEQSEKQRPARPVPSCLVPPVMARRVTELREQKMQKNGLPREMLTAAGPSLAGPLGNPVSVKCLPGSCRAFRICA